ncbi:MULTISPECIES: transcription termination factor NusA [Olivibacter]|jgi:N utilization substance protein A|uniref:Transcription termination/antitermination protein NusA n=3 Tax=Sphingobacteriaceae TaxID=84566 RepID=F4C571_SPHS2|nr:MULTISPECIES: transcription termination factor NusA [Olivibacter]MCL4639464.1 transcription termination factor NusA [Olivibacter sp. UJ_SKK_5.1]MDM8176969.1 transcription termination factor NusA [Olivibacter sp. 47]MDX3912465.1 transcription termination factor NusA [Pseudosphingobacterium sp.]QEL00185.1 transcription termination/antitermination protein NusA [Olivibacter sp. LS-1]
MSNINLIDSFQEFKDFKNIDRPTVISVLEEVFRSMIRKRFGTDENCDVIVNPDNGDLEIWRTRTVVEDEFSEDDDLEIELAEARKVDPDLEIGDDFIEEITLESFGRRAILAARQTLVSKVLELEKDEIFKKYKDRVGEIVTGEVYQIWKKETLVLDDEGNELILPKTEQIPADYFKKGDTIRAVVYKVDMMNTTPKIIISRTAPEFLQRLFELEVPEIFDGLITIKKIVREPGERAKVAVESYDDRIDPVGACVGMKGSRIHGIVRELRNENIDVINFTNNISLYIQRALSPARISSIKLDDEEKRAAVYLQSDQVSLAIGRGGHNIKLAGKLTGYEIDVYRESDENDEDVDLEEFADEIDGWILDEFKRVGLDTAKSVLALSMDELVRRTDLEENTIQEVVQVLRSEFE